ncbi:MAG: hypothetical protein ABGW81_01790 [Paracoccaceae bacterium]
MKMKKMVRAALSIGLLRGGAALAQGKGKSDEARNDVNNGNAGICYRQFTNHDSEF